MSKRCNVREDVTHAFKVDGKNFWIKFNHLKCISFESNEFYFTFMENNPELKNEKLPIYKHQPAKHVSSLTTEMKKKVLLHSIILYPYLFKFITIIKGYYPLW